MSALRQLWYRIRGLVGRGALESRLDEEVRFHIDQQAAEYVRRGLDPAAAREAAWREFGGVEAHKEAVRDEVRLPGLEDAWSDARHAVRVLRRSPTFCAVAVLTIGIGIGATTSIFSVVDSVLLRGLPWPASEALVVPVTVDVKTGEEQTVTWADHLGWKRAGVFADVAVYQTWEMNIADPQSADRVKAAVVSDGFFGALRAPFSLGRDFRPEEFAHDAPRVVLLSHELWQRQFGGDPSVLGRTIRVGGFPREVVGVLRPGMAFPFDARLWVPLRIAPEERASYERYDNYIFMAVARLAPGGGLEQARVRLAALAARVARDQPRIREDMSVSARPLLEWVVGEDLPRALWLFMGAVGLVLLTGCFNLANLLLSRASARRREFAIRGAIGAARGRLVRQLLTESVVLALAGGLLGVSLAAAGVKGLLLIAPEETPRLNEVSLSLPALAFALVASLLSAIVFGLAPAFALARETVANALGDDDHRTAGGVRGRRTRNVLAGAEVALSLVLLMGAGLLLKSLQHLRRVDTGLDRDGVVTIGISLQGERYEEDAAVHATYRDLLERISALPGVESASAVSALPLGGGGFYLGRNMLKEGDPEPPAGKEVDVMWTAVTPGFFRTLRIPLLKGRDFTPSDVAGAKPVVIVNEEFVRRMFPDGDALGRRAMSSRDERLYREIVGVTKDVRYLGAADKRRPIVYVPDAQDSYRSMMLVVRDSGDPAAVIGLVRSVVRDVDPALALGAVRTMDQVFARSVASQRFGATLLTGFSVVALLLATIGVYGVVSYAVAQRNREFGIRLALGARRRDIISLVLREGVALALAGVAVGILVALLGGRAMTALLFGIEPTDGPTFAAVSAMMLGVTTLASCLPASRASRADPMQVIRLD